MKAECNDLQIILSYAVAASSSSWFIFLFLFPSSSCSLFHLLSHLIFFGVSVREWAGLIISVASFRRCAWWVPAGYLAATPAFHQHISHPEYSWSNSVIHASPDSTASHSVPSLFEYLLLTVLWCSCLLPVTSTLKQAYGKLNSWKYSPANPLSTAQCYLSPIPLSQEYSFGFHFKSLDCAWCLCLHNWVHLFWFCHEPDDLVKTTVQSTVT